MGTVRGGGGGRGDRVRLPHMLLRRVARVERRRRCVWWQMQVCVLCTGWQLWGLAAGGDGVAGGLVMRQAVGPMCTRLVRAPSAHVAPLVVVRNHHAPEVIQLRFLGYCVVVLWLVAGVHRGLVVRWEGMLRRTAPAARARSRSARSAGVRKVAMLSATWSSMWIPCFGFF